jgi:glutamate formiminotransferase / formiminotetrahydrofolate cyclodeaminase
MEQLIECIPNFSEGRDTNIIRGIEKAIRSVNGVTILHIDQGYDANRTVITFAGPPLEVCEAAFRATAKAAELIDMRVQKGTHPRIGATDVLPLVPLKNISMEQTVEWAHILASRIGNELNIPVYCYEKAAFVPGRITLSDCRSGEYESLPGKLASQNGIPDFGPMRYDHHVAKTGATIVGARAMLVAYNLNLNTQDVSIARSIAALIREKGPTPKELELPPLKKFSTIREISPAKLKGIRAIGWYIDAYGFAQVSCNITDYKTTPLHVVFEAASNFANLLGCKITGSELIGLLPLDALTSSGKHFLPENKGEPFTEIEILNRAIKKLGLDQLKPFNPKERIIEYLIP